MRLQKPMEKISDNLSRLDQALGYLRMELPIIPLVGKRPAVKDWQRFALTRVHACYFFGSRTCNIGMRTGAYIVIDVDTEEAMQWVNGKNIDSPMKVRTGSGNLHIYLGSPRNVAIRN